MSPAQKSLIWREWKKAADWYLAHGKTKADLDGLRHLLIRQACGSDLSMADWRRWTNGQVDRVLAKFRAVHDGGNLAAQIRAAEQPGQRLRKMEAEVHNLAREVYPDSKYIDPDFTRTNMLNGISRRINYCAFAEIKTERQMGAVIGVLRKQLQRRERAAAEAHTTAEQPDGNPF